MKVTFKNPFFKTIWSKQSSINGMTLDIHRHPSTFSRLGMNPFQKNPKHASVLAER